MDREEVSQIYDSLDEEEKEIIKRRLEDESLLSISMKTHRGYSTVNKINGQILAAFGVKRWGEIKDELETVVDKPIEEIKTVGEVESKPEEKKRPPWVITIVIATIIYTCLCTTIGSVVSEDIFVVMSITLAIIAIMGVVKILYF